MRVALMLGRVGFFFALAIAVAPSPVEASGASDRWSYSAAVDLEYSGFLDAYGTANGHELTGFGQRLRALASHGPWAFGASLSIFPVLGFSESMDLFVGRFFPLRPSGLFLFFQGGLGLLHTTDGTKIPTFTDVRVGPSGHLAATLSWAFWRQFFVQASLSGFLYPSQPLITLPIGLDLRWSLGAGVQWNALR